MVVICNAAVLRTALSQVSQLASGLHLTENTDINPRESQIAEIDRRATAAKSAAEKTCALIRNLNRALAIISPHRFNEGPAKQQYIGALC